MKRDRLDGDSLLFGGLVLLTGSVIRMGASIYLPAMPMIGEHLHISRQAMSTTLSVYFMVFSSCILVAGSLSDAYGRRPLLLCGVAVFCLGSLGCALSHSLAGLMMGRIIQALGASMIPGTLMAMIRDACTGVRVVALTGWLSVLGGLLLVTAPMLGGVLTHYLGWAANFWFLALFSGGVLAAIIMVIPETLAPDRRIPARLSTTLILVGRMLGSPAFFLVLLPVIGCFALQGAYLAASPYILMTGYHLSPVAFGACNIIIVVGLFLGRWAGAVVYRQQGGDQVFRASGMAALGVVVLFVAIGPGSMGGMIAFLVVVGCFAAVFGALMPVGMKSSLTAFRDNSGVAAALQGTLLLGASALGSGAVGLLMHRLPGISVLDGFSLIAAGCCLVVGISSLVARPV